MRNHPDESDLALGQFFRDPAKTGRRPWNPTPETCKDPSKLKWIESCFYREIKNLRDKKELNVTKTERILFTVQLDQATTRQGQQTTRLTCF